MFTPLLIFLGAGFGGVMRYWVSRLVYGLTGASFPYGTLVVNISGCFLMGLLFVILVERLDGTASHLRSLLLIGFLGGYTTFSSFSIETLNLLENGAVFSVASNIILSLMLSLAATWLGMIGGRML